MPSVSAHQAARVQGRTQRAQAPAAPALDERGDGEGEGHGEADIAQIEKGRMEGEAGILQERVQVAAVRGRGMHPEKRVGREQDEGQEADANQPLDPEHPRLQGRRQVLPEPGDHRSEQRQDQNPEQHRALVVAPDARHLVEQRLRRMAVLDDVEDRKVRRHIGVHQGQKGEEDQAELSARRGAAGGHQPRMARRRPPERQGRLQDRDQQRQHQGEMAKLDDHCPVSSVPAARARKSSALFSASSTSGGW